MTRIQQKFDQLKRQGRKAFIPYITLGDPSLEASVEIILELARAGADVIELGIPFSDPLADGPVIQRATERALQRGFTLRAGLRTVAELRKQTEVPFLLFSYYNPLFAHGLERLAQDARASGIDGVLITDLSVEEAAGPVKHSERGGARHRFSWPRQPARTRGLKKLRASLPASSTRYPAQA